MLEATVRKPEPEATLSVDKKVMVDAWSLMEKVVVSLRRIGSVYAHSASGTTPELIEEERKALAEFFDPELVKGMTQVRRKLGELIPDDEAEAI